MTKFVLYILKSGAKKKTQNNNEKCKKFLKIPKYYKFKLPNKFILKVSFRNNPNLNQSYFLLFPGIRFQSDRVSDNIKDGQDPWRLQDELSS